MIITFVILGVTILLFVINKLRPDVVAMLSLLALFLTGVLTAPQALAGFSDSTVIMVAALFVVGEGLAQTGITAWMGQRLTGWAGSSETRLLIALMLGTALLSAFLSNTGTIAVLMPAVVAAVWRMRGLPSRFLMPMAFAASMGGLMTLIGTPPNIVISDTLIAAGLQPFSFFDFAKIGLPLLMCAVVFMVFIGRRLLPERESAKPAANVEDWMSSVVESYRLERHVFRLRVRQGSSLVGKTLQEAELGAAYQLSVVAIQPDAKGKDTEAPQAEKRPAFSQLHDAFADSHGLPGPQSVVHAEDILIVKGSREAAERAMVDFNLGMTEVAEGATGLPDVLVSPEVGVAEVMLAPRSRFIGMTLIEAQIAQQYGVQVLSIMRATRILPRATTQLQFGDALLVRGAWDDIARFRNDGDNFVVVGMPESMATQIARFTLRSWIALAALALMVGLMVTSAVPTVMAVLITAMIMVLFKCLPLENVYRAINWPTVVLIAATLPLSTALQVTGGAQVIVDTLVKTVGAMGPIPLMAAIFLLTAGFSQVISNTATTVLVAPIVLQMATNLGISPYPLLAIVAVGASAAFLTPIASPVNTLVMTPGGYRFNDYVKVGLPLLLIAMVLSLVLAPIFWPM